MWSSTASIGPQLNSTNASNNGSGNPLRFAGATNDFFADNSFPHVAYASGCIYIVYADTPSSGWTVDRGDIFLLEAQVVWSNHSLTNTAGPRKVNTDHTETDQWDPSIVANPSGSELFIGYYSRQNDPTTNSWTMAFGARAFITNGLASVTFDCFPVSPTQFQPMFAGTNAPSNVWAFEPVWPQGCLCLDTNAVYANVIDCTGISCPNWPNQSSGFETDGTYANFCADDYTWSVSDSNYFYFAWCDRSRTNGIAPKTRPDADIKLAKIRP